jgi:hypothetical protein
MRQTVSFVALLILAMPTASFAQHVHAPATAAVDFGILPLVKIGDAPCSQAPPFGGPLDQCAYTLHVLTPNEVTVAKGGEVSFQIHGGGHGFAIYEVSKNTTRDDIGQQLCAGDDPATIPLPGALHTCNNGLGLGGNANIMREVFDGKGDVVLVEPPNAGTHPTNRVSYAPGRLMSANAAAFLNGGTIPAGATSNGEILTYRFLKTGRYLVLCMNRSHFFNDWMFGFVDVQEVKK